MKPILQQESTRRDYHRDAQKNAVHRSSLLVPCLAGAEVDINFVNHFLLKRNEAHVTCRLTAIDAEGQRIESRSFPICDPRVYAFEPRNLWANDVANTMVEFFSSANLFIPFPAVMVNHRGPHFLNMVHSYNRVLNDVFEDDLVNADRVREASIDVRVDDATDAFLVVAAGPSRCQGELAVTLESPSGRRSERIELDVPRLTHRSVSLRELFGTEIPLGAVLKVAQPPQPMFYGRMLGGLRSRADDAFAANHSFYDCSNLHERWPDGRASSRTYPLLPGFTTRVRLYPIFSPCVLLGELDLYDARGRLVGSVACEPLESPSAAALDVSVTDAAQAVRSSEIVSFRYRAWAQEGGTPRRINHQIVYGDAAGRSPLCASVAISLRNPNAFVAGGTQGLTWGQCAVSEDYDTRLGIVLDDADAVTVPVELRWFGEAGEVRRMRKDLVAGAAWVIDPAEVVPELVARSGSRPHYLWYWLTCPRPDLAAYSVVRNKRTGHCSGEHSF